MINSTICLLLYRSLSLVQQIYCIFLQFKAIYFLSGIPKQDVMWDGSERICWNREYKLEFKRKFAQYQPEITCVQMLVELQKKQNLSLKELTKITGIRQYKLRQILNGKRILTLKILQKIAEGLGKSVKMQII